MGTSFNLSVSRERYSLIVLAHGRLLQCVRSLSREDFQALCLGTITTRRANLISSDFFKKALIVLSAECPSEGATDKINSTRRPFRVDNVIYHLDKVIVRIPVISAGSDVSAQ